MTIAKREEYLGDGVYATWDGYQLVLDCRAQMELPTLPNGAPCIVLEPQVVNALVEFYNKCMEDMIDDRATVEGSEGAGDDEHAHSPNGLGEPQEDGGGTTGDDIIREYAKRGLAPCAGPEEVPGDGGPANHAGGPDGGGSTENTGRTGPPEQADTRER